MNETQRRIKAYQEALPGLRERVIAVALLLAMSAAMMTSASFAWLTISRRPELTGVNTTVAANGNLEIALVGEEGWKPDESVVGDSSAAKGQSVTAANITWGNLVNLSDESYGLENLTLRPAQLNTASLLDSPLYGAVYGQDGRITQLSSNFGYATWDEEQDRFFVTDKYGVRAISSTKIEAVGAEAKYYDMVTTARNQNLAAANMYIALGNNGKYMPSLATMMGLYMTARMNPSDASLSNPSCNIADIQNLRDMYGDFLECFDMEAQALASLVNLQLFLKSTDGNYDPYTAEMIYETTTAELKAKGIQVQKLGKNLEEFTYDRNIIASDYEKLVSICNSGTSLKWQDSGLNSIVNNLVDVGKCTIGADNTPISSIGASNAMGYLSGTQEARITNGILYRFEQRTGGYIEVKGLSISATVKRSGITVPASVKANIQTTASRDTNLFSEDIAYAESLNTGDYGGGVPVANDTYGLAIDLWVRTNAAGSYLTLEGNVLTESKTVRATGTDANGNMVELYTVTLTVESEDEEGNPTTASFTVDLYQVVQNAGTADEIITWYKAEDHSVLTEADMGDAKPIAKMETVVTVIGYEGENRIWGDNEELSVDSTTQGSGSCYVYYADTPEDQARSLKLLEAFNVAFVGADGKLIGKAIMDTEHFYAANGRVIVPLVLDPSASINLGEDFEGTVSYGLTALEQNVATRITAIVYLDGTKLTNQEVLAAADIQGQLNIQFGSSQQLSPLGNEALELAERRVSATLDNVNFDYDTATEPMTTNVTVHVDGDKPAKVTAFFVRAISSTQGSREKTMTFTQTDSGDWVASHTFTAPGTYVLRTVRLDGVDYDLANPPSVSISGFAVNSLSCEQATGNHVNIMTANDSSTVKLNLKFAADSVDKMPRTVVGRYLREEDGSAVNVEFTLNPTTQIWSGSATFLVSGNYTMQYLVLDGNYAELPGPTYDDNNQQTSPGLWQTAHVTLGMRVAVYTTSPTIPFKYDPNTMADNEKLLGMQVMIMDNAGNEMPGLTGAKLTYTMRGSGIKKMDTDLTWDGSYYVGELTTSGPGIWQFGNVEVGANILTTATTYPTFTVQSPEPPQYYGNSTAAYQYKPNKDAVMEAQITHSAAADGSIQAYIIKDGDSEGKWVNGTMGGTNDATAVTNWSFKVPGDANDYQDGNWTMTAIRLWGVFAEDGTEYTQESPLVFDLTEKNISTKVVNRVYVSFATNKSKDFGKDADGNVTAQLMDSHTISNLDVDIKDFTGNPVQGVTDVKLIFAYQSGTSNTYGSYKLVNDQGNEILTNATDGATITVALDKNSGTNYAQSQDATILYAGNYITTFIFKISGTEYKYGDLDGDGFKDNDETDLPANAPKFTVSSKAPTVTISNVSTIPAGARFYSTENPSSSDHVITGLKNWKSDNGFSTSVFIYIDGPSGPMDTELVTLKYPSVTLNVTGIPTDHSGMEVVVNNASNSSQSNVFTFGAGETQKSGSIGAGQNGTFSYGTLGFGAGVETWPKLYPVGKQEIKTIGVTYKNMDFVMTLSRPVNISQVTLPPYADLIIDESTYSGATRIYSEDTQNVVLDKITWSLSGVEIGDDATVGAWSKKTLHTDHGYKTWSTWIITSERYMPFYWTEFSRTIEGTQTPYTTTYTINKWIVNGTEYDVSQNAVSIPVTGSIQATAVVTVNTVYGTTTATKTIEYKYGYLKGSEQSGNPGGNQIGPTVNSRNGAYDNPTIGIANESTLDNMYDDKNKYLECDNRAG